MEVSQILIQGNPSNLKFREIQTNFYANRKLKKHKVNDNDLFSNNNN